MFQGSAVPSAAKLHQRQNLRQFYRCRQEGVGVFPIFIIGRYFGRFRSGNATKCRDRASIQKKILIANLLKPYDYEYEKDCLVDVCRLHGYIWMQFVYCG